jgi:hypothetical protein
MKKAFILMMAVCVATGIAAKKSVVNELKFDTSKGEPRRLTLPTGQTVEYTAYEKLWYVSHVEDTTYQYMNVYVPEGATQQSPIFFKNNIGGYMPSAPAGVSAGDATGMALLRGYVVAIPGARGRMSYVTVKKKKVYNGKAPAAILDLKAAVRYLRHFDKEMPGDAGKIVSDGTSAGGAMSALLGASGNNPAYEPLLEKMGAAKERDDIFAAVCYCPITDLAHADMAYEWLYGSTDSRKSADAAHQTVSKEEAALFPAYIQSLNLHLKDGTRLTADNYLDFIKSEIIRAAQIAKDAGAEIPDTIGFTFSTEGGTFAPLNGGVKPAGMPKDMPAGRPATGKRRPGEYITGLDMAKYLNYVARTTPLKSAPAFDALGVAGNSASGENDEFGDAANKPANFTPYSAQKNGTPLSETVRANELLLNPMQQIGAAGVTVAPHWYIRHGAIDRDTAFPIPLNLAVKLLNNGKDVNYLLAWNRPHSGDYALQELFDWLDKLVK